MLRPHALSTLISRWVGWNTSSLSHVLLMSCCPLDSNKTRIEISTQQPRIHRNPPWPCLMFVESFSRAADYHIREKRDYDLKSHNIVLTTLFQKGERIAFLREEEEKGHRWTTHASLFARWCIRYMYVLLWCFGNAPVLEEQLRQSSSRDAGGTT